MDARWDLKVISCAPCMRTLVVEGTLGHARWMRGEIWKVILCAPRMRTLLLDVTSSMSQGQMRKICRNFPLYTFLMSSRVDVRWHLKSHLASTSCENFGVLGHARWTQDEIWKVISHAPHMRTFPLYTFQISSRMDVRWHLKSHLMCTSCENFGVVEGTLGHARWVWGDIWKVISCAPCMRTLVYWRGHLVTLDRWTWGEIWKVISCAPHVKTLVWWRGHLVTLDGCKVMFEKSSCVHLMWELWCCWGDTWLC